MPALTRRLILGLTLVCLALPAQAEGLYAAIAFSPATGRAGSSWNFDTTVLAETEANLQCGAADCYTAVVFQECGAIAVGDGYGMGYGLDPSQDKASALALQSCTEYTSNCQITAAFCNDGY